MKYSLTTTPLRVVDPQDYPRTIHFSAATFSTAVAVYIAPEGTKSVQLVLSANGSTQGTLVVPKGVSLDAYTDAGTAELVTSRNPCPWKST